jgi:hypothetical protein
MYLSSPFPLCLSVCLSVLSVWSVWLTDWLLDWLCSSVCACVRPTTLHQTCTSRCRGLKLQYRTLTNHAVHHIPNPDCLFNSGHQTRGLDLISTKRIVDFQRSRLKNLEGRRQEVTLSALFILLPFCPRNRIDSQVLWLPVGDISLCPGEIAADWNRVWRHPERG